MGSEIREVEELFSKGTAGCRWVRMKEVELGN